MDNASTWFFPFSFRALLEHFIKEHEMKKEKTKWVHYPKENTSKNALALYLIYRAAAAVWYAFASPAHPNKCHLKQASNIRISYDGGQTLRRPRVQMLKLFGRVSSMKNGEELKKTPIIIFLSSCIKKRSIVCYETHPIILAAIAISGHEYHKATREGGKKLNSCAAAAQCKILTIFLSLFKISHPKNEILVVLPTF